MTWRVLLTDQVFPDITVERDRLAEVDCILDVADGSTTNIRELAPMADGVLTTYAPIDRATIDTLGRCKIIARYGIGVDNIDLKAARERGIVVTNVPDYCLDEVADHTMALLLATARKIVRGNDLVRRGEWGASLLTPVHRLRGQTMGLIGYGAIAKRVATRAITFGLNIVSYDPKVSSSEVDDFVELVGSLDELLAMSNFVSVHARLNNTTRNMLDAKAIGRMRRGAVLINTSRGPIVALEAVLDAIRTGHLAAAGIDVFPSEPPHPADFRDLPAVVVTPHSAFYSDEAILESQTRAVEEVISVLTGQEVRNRVA